MAGTTSLLAAAFTDSTWTSSPSRTRAGPSASPALRRDRTSADFLLGLPHTSSIAFGNADTFLRGNSYDVYVTDDWRIGPGLTVNAGVRWEYEAPITEQFGRLVNLDIAPGFTAVSPVIATDPVGTLTGQRYPDSLLRPDRRGIQPRLGVAWRPIAGSSLVIRAGYGVYRNTAVYQAIDLLLAQQPPLSKAQSVETSAAAPLTLANGFIAPPAATLEYLRRGPGLPRSATCRTGRCRCSATCQGH